ncbi:MAG: hypothetical protein RQ761_01660 [Bacteroidales bacterium]|nr:hypothetical protein [Bacteroidales bacterium]
MMRMIRAIIYVFVTVMSITGIVRAQDVAAEARLDTTEMLIGDQIKLNISFNMPMDYRVLWPFYQDTLTQGLEIISQTPVDTIISEDENLVNMLQSITITAFDSGQYYIPPLKFRYQPIDDTSFMEVSSMPLYLEVHTMEVDTTKPIKAIKPPLDAPFSIREILPWMLMALGAILITLLIVYVVTRIKRKQPVFSIKPKPVLPPDIVAISGLEKLKSKKLWQAGRTKDYYSELTDIIRTYIEDSFEVQAVEMTTDEIIEGLKRIDVSTGSLKKLSKTLMLADLVKFAKEKPLPLDNENSMTNCVDFVNETRIRAENNEETEEDIQTHNAEVKDRH